MTDPELRVSAGAMLALRLYDVAYAIDLARVEALGSANAPESVGRLRLTRAEAKAIALPDPPVEIGLGPDGDLHDVSDALRDRARPAEERASAARRSSRPHRRRADRT